MNIPSWLYQQLSRLFNSVRRISIAPPQAEQMPGYLLRLGPGHGFEHRHLLVIYRCGDIGDDAVEIAPGQDIGRDLLNQFTGTIHPVAFLTVMIEQLLSGKQIRMVMPVASTTGKQRHGGYKTA